MKRIFDLIIALILLITLAPLFVLICIIIKATSKGPIIFKQKRIGKNNKEFYILKFRTMYTETPHNIPTHLLENPQQFITPIGKLLRKTSLDELPQLINILKGEMSFVGPRPSLYNQKDLIELRTEHAIHKLIPGITGWAQVNGRDELSVEAKVKFDKYYLENYSFLFDLNILGKTFFYSLTSKGIVEGKKEFIKN